MTAALTTPTNYATTPAAFISKCKFSLTAIPDVTNGTSIAFDQHESLDSETLGKGPTAGRLCVHTCYSATYSVAI